MLCVHSHVTMCSAQITGQVFKLLCWIKVFKILCWIKMWAEILQSGIPLAGYFMSQNMNISHKIKTKKKQYSFLEKNITEYSVISFNMVVIVNNTILLTAWVIIRILKDVCSHHACFHKNVVWFIQHFPMWCVSNVNRTQYRVQKRWHHKKLFFWHFSILDTMYQWSMMKNIHSPNWVGIGSWGPEIWPHEYLISPTEINVN